MRTDAVPFDSIVALVRDLVRIPSRAGEDDLGPVLQRLEGWLRAQRLSFRPLQGAAGEPLGLYAEVRGRAGPGPWTVLNATLDTAGFGSPERWSRGPTSGEVADGWLHGRGSADSKVGVALFVHLLREFAARPGAFGGRLGVLFDLDEHSGGFGGARAFFDQPFDGGAAPRPDGVIIGYPGMDRIVTGGRGFLRARLVVHGVAAHSGASRRRGVNAIGRAFALAQALSATPLPPADTAFALPPQLTWTGVHGGSEGFTQIPDRCELGLDVRLTPAFDAEAARTLVEHAVRELDSDRGDAPPTTIAWLPGWPASCLADTHPMVVALRTAAREELAQDLPTGVVGPSNIGNYLAGLGVPSLCGFGVTYRNIHAADEAIDLDSIAPVYRIYRHALQRLQRA